MCVVSMVADHYRDKFWPNQLPDTQPGGFQLWPQTIQGDSPTKQEFEALKREVEEMKALLQKAKIYDEEHDQPDCEMEDKVSLLRRLARELGVDLGDALPST